MLLSETTLAELEQMSELEEEELTLLTEGDKAKTLRLLMAISAIVSKTCGSHSKLHEKTTQLELALEGKESVHVKHEYGTDLRIKDDESDAMIDVEVKTSVVKKAASHRSNWIFTVSANATLETLRLKYSGKVHFIAIMGNKTLARYVLSGRFVASYLMRCLERRRVASVKPHTVNMGSAYCTIHKVYHRMENFLYYDELGRDLTEEEWTTLFRDVTATH